MLAGRCSEPQHLGVGCITQRWTRSSGASVPYSGACSCGGLSIFRGLPLVGMRQWELRLNRPVTFVGADLERQVHPLPLVVLVLATIEGSVYLLNPFRASGDDPRLRLWGVRLLGQASQSMEPTIQRKAPFLVSAWPNLNSGPKVGDIIAFSYPTDPGHELYAKRVVATRRIDGRDSRRDGDSW